MLEMKYNCWCRKKIFHVDMQVLVCLDFLGLLWTDGEAALSRSCFITECTNNTLHNVIGSLDEPLLC